MLGDSGLPKSVFNGLQWAKNKSNSEEDGVTGIGLHIVLCDPGPYGK